MGSLAGGRLDEAHCFWPLCPHPGCWQAEQRVLRGKPRMMGAQTSSGAAARASEVDEFPTLNVVNASEWTEVKVLLKSLRSEDEVCQDATNVLSSLQDLPRGAERHVNAHYLKYNSATLSHLETNRENKTVKLNTAQIHPLSGCTSVSQPSEKIMMWIPNSHYMTPQNQHSVKPAQVAIKELICLPAVKCSTSSDKKKILKQEKSREWVQFQQTTLKSPLSKEGKWSPSSGRGTDLPNPGSARAGPDSHVQVEEATTSPRGRRHVPVDQIIRAALEAKDGEQPPRTVEALHITNKPMMFHPAWERIQRRHTPEDHPDYKYKLDTKSAVDGIDWERLKRQTYLWRKHIQAANYERGKHPSLKDKAGYHSLHPIPKPALRYGLKTPPSTGTAKCQCMDCMKGMWQSYSRVLASQSKACLFRSDARLKTGHQGIVRTSVPIHTLFMAVDEDGQSDTELDMKGIIPPRNSQETLTLATSEMQGRGKDQSSTNETLWVRSPLFRQ